MTYDIIQHLDIDAHHYVSPRHIQKKQIGNTQNCRCIEKKTKSSYTDPRFIHRPFYITTIQRYKYEST